MHIFLFHRDLRLTDNTTLIHQMKECNSVVPVFIFPPEQIDPIKNKYFSNNSVQFMIESLHELSDDIKKKDGKMYFFKGENLKVLRRLHKTEKIESIAFNVDYTPYARKRDKEIKDWCERHNIIYYEKEDYLLYDMLQGQTKKKDGTPYLVYTPFRNHCMTNLKVRAVDKFNKFKFTKVKKLENIPYSLIEKDLDDFYEDNPDINVHGGRSNGLKILSKMEKFKDYSKKRDNLTYKTTFLSAYNHFSPISIREVYHKMIDKLSKNNGLINELHWRDFYVNITYEYPHVLQGQIKSHNMSYKKEYDNINWVTDNKLFNKWCEGKTGFPIIDAAIRQMNTIGYMHNRCRMIVASFLCKDLHINWSVGEKYFAKKLVDYSPMMNNGGWQWAAGTGTDAQPWFRIFNPWTQGQKFDPECEYIKQWIPELKEVPNKEIHNWFKPDIHKKWITKGINYYEPIVDHDEERKRTITLYKAGLK